MTLGTCDTHHVSGTYAAYIAPCKSLAYCMVNTVPMVCTVNIQNFNQSDKTGPDTGSFELLKVMFEAQMSHDSEVRAPRLEMLRFESARSEYMHALPFPLGASPLEDPCGLTTRH